MTITHKEIFQFTQNEKITKVKTNKLDNVLSFNRLKKPILLKIDI